MVGSPWMRYDLSGADVQAVDHAGVDDAWAVGTDGLFAHWDGTGWHAYDNTKLGTSTIYSVDMLSSPFGWAAGAGGRMYRWNGTNWSLDPANLGTTTMYDVKHALLPGWLAVARTDVRAL